MEQCDYWWQDDKTEQCNLISSSCKCGGSNEHCCIKGPSIADALREEEMMTLKESSDRNQRRRHWMSEAS